MIFFQTLSKTRLQRLRGYMSRETLTAEAFRRNHNSVTATHRNRSARSIEHLCNRSRGYGASRLRSIGYAQTLAAQAFHGSVTVVTAVTAKNGDARGATCMQV
ncbi:hypothetical protein SAMN05192548_1005118 [Paraburkholderia terricola]|jgi:hypothetical protein|uniref:Uncharacterized protein n=1 Tax=Paraburkholderia terricola TaxID=169427 RepID=A0A1M6LHE9_9BURK|nr:hypothetical protein SAMN05192547_1005117 [Paraburkholderia sediminicola]SHJ70609.1 hypothetical protein SAMN05192548_1005118 [Paraburkholderia terricola]